MPELPKPGNDIFANLQGLPTHRMDTPALQAFKNQPFEMTGYGHFFKKHLFALCCFTLCLAH